jgi:hypothetical protein
VAIGDHEFARSPKGSCGGFLFQSTDDKDEAAAPVVTLCQPGTFQAGVPNATSPVGYPRGGIDASGLIGGMGGADNAFFDIVEPFADLNDDRFAKAGSGQT